MSELTKKVLYQLKEYSDSSYALPGLIENAPITKDALPRAIKRIQKRVGIPDWTAHDLRRSFATHLGESLQIDPVVIEKCLGHKMPRIMATYNKNEMLPQRKEALNECINTVKQTVCNHLISIPCLSGLEMTIWFAEKRRDVSASRSVAVVSIGNCGALVDGKIFREEHSFNCWIAFIL